MHILWPMLDAVCVEMTSTMNPDLAQLDALGFCPSQETSCVYNLNDLHNANAVVGRMFSEEGAEHMDGSPVGDFGAGNAYLDETIPSGMNRLDEELSDDDPVVCGDTLSAVSEYDTDEALAVNTDLDDMIPCDGDDPCEALADGRWQETI